MFRRRISVSALVSDHDDRRLETPFPPQTRVTLMMGGQTGIAPTRLGVIDRGVIVVEDWLEIASAKRSPSVSISARPDACSIRIRHLNLELRIEPRSAP